MAALASGVLCLESVSGVASSVCWGHVLGVWYGVAAVHESAEVVGGEGVAVVVG